MSTTWYRTGSVTVTQNSSTVLGTGTQWTASVQPGDMFTVDADHFYEVASVDSDSKLILRSAFLQTPPLSRAYAIISTASAASTAELEALVAKAAASALQAEQAQENAQTAQTAAEIAEAVAQASMNAATTASAGAASSASAAAGAASTAGTSAAEASFAACTAATAEDNAQKWAANPEDVVVAGDQYSALHYAAKAAESASQADAAAKVAADSNTSAKGYVDDALAAHVASRNHPAATTEAIGFIELATDAETRAGTDTTRAVTPAGVKAALSKTPSSVGNGGKFAKAAADGSVWTYRAPAEVLSDIGAAATNHTHATYADINHSHPAATTEAMGLIELATSAEAQAGVDTVRAVTPAGLAAARPAASAFPNPPAKTAAVGASAKYAREDHVHPSDAPVAATDTVAGIVELATDAETLTGADTTRAVTPAGLAAARPAASALPKSLASTAAVGVSVKYAREDHVHPRDAPVVATDTVAGIVELATDAETLTGTDITRAVTPAGIKAALAKTPSPVGNGGKFAKAAADGSMWTYRAPAEVLSDIGAAPVIHTHDYATTNHTHATYADINHSHPAATTEALGFIELATSAEAQAGVDAVRAVTPAGLAAARPPASALPNPSAKMAAVGASVKYAREDHVHPSDAPSAASDTVAGIVELATDAEVQVGKDTTRAVTPAGLATVLNGTAPAGAVMAFVRISPVTAPTGWLKCNGQLVSRTTYANLFAAIGTTCGAGDGSTTFQLPDLRGEFVRGWADDRDADKGRVLGSPQADAIQNYSSTITYQRAIVNNAEPRSGVSVVSSGNGLSGPLGGWGAGTITFGPGTAGARTASETYPRNVALLYCIKY